MASPPFNIDQGTPADNGIVSQFPAAERSFRDIVESWLLINHGTDGKHSKIELTSIANPTITAGEVGIWQTSGVLKTRVGAGTVVTFETLPFATQLVFVQAAPPAGWNLNAGLADRVLRVNNTGAGTGGSWTISGLSAQNHTLTIGQLPAHTHGLKIATAGVSGGGPGNVKIPIVTASEATESTGNNEGHGHNVLADGNWRPLYVDVVIASKAT